MKNLKKIASLLLALVMVFALATTASAESGVETPPTKGTITVNSATDGQVYTLYKLFDAEIAFDEEGKSASITYTLPSGKSLEGNAYFELVDGKVVAKEGVTDATLATDAFRTWAKSFGTVVGSPVTAANGIAEFGAVGFGYYFVDSTLGLAISVDSNNPNVEVREKNSAPMLEKVITGASSYDADGLKALAQIGTDVEYKVTITVGDGAENYVFHDTMDPGLSYNGDVQVTGVDNDKYDIKETPDEGDTITIAFDDGIAANNQITITYTAKITREALDDKPAKNTASLSYGHKDTLDSTPVKETSVYNAKFTVTKTDGNQEPLAGASFIVKNSENKYYTYADGVVTWVEDEDDAQLVEAVAVTTTGEDGKEVTAYEAEFVGLANGTYTLIEKVVPTGYNKAADSTFTIAAGDYSADNLVQSATVENNAGTELPTTGGMGTTLFYIVGGILVAAAVVLLVTKKRMSAAE